MGVPRDEGLQAAVQVSPEHVVDSPEEPHRGLPVKLLFVRFTIFFTKETPDTGSKTLSGLELLCPLLESAVVVLDTINHMLVLESRGSPSGPGQGWTDAGQAMSRENCGFRGPPKSAVSGNYVDTPWTQ